MKRTLYDIACGIVKGRRQSLGAFSARGHDLWPQYAPWSRRIPANLTTHCRKRGADTKVRGMMRGDLQPRGRVRVRAWAIERKVCRRAWQMAATTIASAETVSFLGISITFVALKMSVASRGATRDSEPTPSRVVRRSTPEVIDVAKKTVYFAISVRARAWERGGERGKRTFRGDRTRRALPRTFSRGGGWLHGGPRSGRSSSWTR